MKPPSSLALHAQPEAALFGPSKPAQAGLEPRPSPAQGGRPPMDRQSRIHGGKPGRGASLLVLRAARSTREN